jgi:nitroreductase
MTYEELHQLMQSRRSVRHFRAEMPPRELVERILASAVTAPSASNKQPWRFYVVSSRATIERMAAAVREAVDRVAGEIDSSFEESFRAYGDYFTRFENAPLVIAPLYRPLTILSQLTRSADAAVASMEHDSGLIGTSLALQNLLLATHAAGLAASGMTGPLIARAALRDILVVPRTWEIVALVPIGYAAETPPPTSRKEAKNVTQWVP